MAIKNKENERAGVIIADNPTSIVSEQLRTIRTNIQFSMIDEQLQTILVTSSTPESGKTTIATNLAAAFAAEDTRVLLVATDMRKPRLHKIFDLPRNKGLTNLITDRRLELEDVTVETYVENLSVLVCGPTPPNPAELLNSKRMTEIVQTMKEQYDLIIFDSPPVLAVTDAQILATKVDGTLFVVPEGEVTKEELQNATERLKNVDAKVLGTIMNKVKNGADDYYYYESE